jgi:hypothetical protein
MKCRSLLRGLLVWFTGVVMYIHLYNVTNTGLWDMNRAGPSTARGRRGAGRAGAGERGQERGQAAP